MSRAYYNEFDPRMAAWLRELIAAKLIPEGHVDERSITEVQPEDLEGYIQLHFFAGLAAWPLALDLAGWPRDRPIWTGSCPCQPFSGAGKQKGAQDERHLWPAWFRLIRECRPDRVVGEQVASAIGHGWLDGVQSDLEAEDYAVGHCVLGAHSVGAPHIRQRLYWLADADCGLDGRRSGQSGERPEEDSPGPLEPGRCRLSSELANPEGERESAVSRGARQGLPQPHGGRGDGRLADAERGAAERQRLDMGGPSGTGERATREQRLRADTGSGGDTGVVANPQRDRLGARSGDERGADCTRSENGHDAERCCSDGVALGDTIIPRLEGHAGHEPDGREPGRLGADEARPASAAGGDGHVFGSSWARFAVVQCRDGKIRRIPAEPVLLGVADGAPGVLGAGGDPCAPEIAEAAKGHPLAAKFPGRVPLLHGLGNAINVETAALFIASYLDLNRP